MVLDAAHHMRFVATEFADLIDVLKEAAAEDPVYVPARGWMTVGDLRWELPPGLAGDTQ